VTAIPAGGKRAIRKLAFSGIELSGVPSTEYPQGALVGFDTASPGLLVRGDASATFTAIGHVTESKTLGASGGKIHVTLFKERTAFWYRQGPDAVVATDIGGFAYALDDQTVNRDDNTNTLSVLGRVWRIDTLKGVLVEPSYAPYPA
jgi:hypothetical protein